MLHYSHNCLSDVVTSVHFITSCIIASLVMSRITIYLPWRVHHDALPVILTGVERDTRIYCVIRIVVASGVASGVPTPKVYYNDSVVCKDGMLDDCLNVTRGDYKHVRDLLHPRPFLLLCQIFTSRVIFLNNAARIAFSLFYTFGIKLCKEIARWLCSIVALSYKYK